VLEFDARLMDRGLANFEDLPANHANWRESKKRAWSNDRISAVVKPPLLWLYIGVYSRDSRAKRLGCGEAIRVIRGCLLKSVSICVNLWITFDGGFATPGQYPLRT